MTGDATRYPPKAFVVTDLPSLHRVIQVFSLATLISMGDTEIMVSHVPLVLRPDQGAHGTLVGHLDRNNPHAGVLDGMEVVAVFSGPDTYISPTVYATQQLPTWNSIKVHVRGTAKVTRSSEAVRQSLVRMAEHLEQGAEKFVLTDHDPRVAPLLGHIVGFEIAITSIEGRFKLGQDKSAADRARTAQHLLASTPPDLEQVVSDLLKAVD